MREILTKHIRQRNKDREKAKKLPFAVAHIVDIPREETIEQALKEVQKVNWLKFRFFPLNNDLDISPLFEIVREGMNTAGSKTGSIKFNSPGNKQGIQKVMVSTSGLVESSMEVTDADGEIRRIKEGTFSSNTKIEYEGNLNIYGDMYIALQAKKNRAMNTVSEENAKLYDQNLEMLNKLMRQF